MTNTTHIYNLDELQDRRIMMDKKLPPYGYALIILTGFLMVYLLLWSTKNYRTYVSQSTGTVQAKRENRIDDFLYYDTTINYLFSKLEAL